MSWWAALKRKCRKSVEIRESTPNELRPRTDEPDWDAIRRVAVDQGDRIRAFALWVREAKPASTFVDADILARAQEFNVQLTVSYNYLDRLPDSTDASPIDFCIMSFTRGGGGRGVHGAGQSFNEAMMKSVENALGVSAEPRLLIAGPSDPRRAL